jgi:hypothetical protein
MLVKQISAFQIILDDLNVFGGPVRNKKKIVRLSLLKRNSLNINSKQTDIEFGLEIKITSSLKL